MQKKNDFNKYEQQAMERINSLIAEECGGSQQRFSEKTGINKGSISQYTNGKNVPSNFTAKKIADAFNLNPAWVMGFDVPMKPKAEQTNYYVDNETAQIAQEIFDNKDLRILFDAAKDAKPQDLKMAADMLKRFKETNLDG